MAVWAGRPDRLTYPQAVPIGDYRRKLFFETQFPKLVLLVAALTLYTSSASPWVHPYRTVDLGPALMPMPASREQVEAAAVAAAEVTAISASEVAVDAVATNASAMRYLAQGQASLGGIGGASYTNALIAISYIDGYVIAPGGQFSFDDVARSWDGREDPRYLWSVGTSAYGLIPMRGGGVCWVSTALWRAALWSGLPTDYRQNHLGIVPTIGVGTDATNTVVIRNDSTVPITVRAWIDDEDVNVALLAEEAIGRTARVRGPDRVGPGSYVLYQDVRWADGTTNTSSFYSGYYW